MKIQILEKKDKKLKFSVKDSDYTALNALRRTIISDIPSIAVDKLVIYENSSHLYDEILSKRLAMVPLTTDLKTYSIRKDCKCNGKGCARCEVGLILEKSGPGTVYSKDIKSRDPKVKPVYDKIPLVTLAEGQKLRMELVAILGTAREHAKFQGALASYKQIDDTNYEFFIESYNNLTPSDCMNEAISVIESYLGDFDKAFEAAKKPKEKKPKAEKEKPKEKKPKKKVTKKETTKKAETKKKAKKEVKKKAGSKK